MILHVAASARTIVRFRLPILLGQRERGHPVEIACRPDQPYAEQLEKAGFTLHALPMPFSEKAGLGETWKALQALTAFLKKNRYAVVHGHQPLGGLIATLAAGRAGVPKIFYTTGGLKSHEGQSRPMRWLTRSVERYLFHHTDAIFSVNREDIETMRRRHLAPMERVYFVGPRGGCGIDTGRFKPLSEGVSKADVRKKLGLPVLEEGPVIGFVGRLTWEKGLHELVSAMGLLEKKFGGSSVMPQLLLIGEGPDHQALEALIRTLDLQNRIFLLGNRSDVPELLTSFDLLALPSYREGMPTVILEAWAAKIPVVATSIRGARELINDGKSGLLVPPRDTAGLAEAMEKLLLDPDFAQRLGEAGYDRLQGEYADTVLLPRHLDLLEALVKA